MTPAASPVSCSVGVVLSSMVYVTLNGLDCTMTAATGGIDPPPGPLTGRSDGCDFEDLLRPKMLYSLCSLLLCVILKLDPLPTKSSG